MSRTATATRPRRSTKARGQRLIAGSLLVGIALAALYLVGHGLLPHHAPERTTSPRSAGQLVPYRSVLALLAQARSRDPRLRLPHARWFIRIRHGHAQVIVVEHAPLRDGGNSVTGTGGGQ